jgi:hypothetical protein
MTGPVFLVIIAGPFDSNRTMRANDDGAGMERGKKKLNHTPHREKDERDFLG